MSSGIEKNWISIQNNDFDGLPIRKYVSNPVIIQLLANKGIISEEQVKSYLYPSFADLNDPFLLPGMQDAVSRIKKALDNNEGIIIFGDYDTDGIISTALLYNFLKKINPGMALEHHIPDRFEEGYDISPGFFKKIGNTNKCRLIICVDCGTNAFDVMHLVHSADNLPDIIACDHHEPSGGSKNNGYENKYCNCDIAAARQETLNALSSGFQEAGNCRKYIIVNPKMPGSIYPYKYLSGAGVTFKLIGAVLKSLDDSAKNLFPAQYLNNIIDLVAVATIADLMPLTGENRIIVKAGLKTIKNSKNPGLFKMIEKILEGKKQITAYDIGFIISPRLNASGRLKHAKKSLELLIDGIISGVPYLELPGEIESTLDELEELNRDRQELQQKISREITGIEDLENKINQQRILIEKSSLWNEGVLGIVASDIVKKYNVPVILFKQNGNILKGSGRSTGYFDLYANLCQFEKYFIKFGGHRQACGITMDIKDFGNFSKEMNAYVSGKISMDQISRKYFYDMEIIFEDIDFNLLKELERLEPYGMANLKPVFLAKNCTMTTAPSFLKDGNHAIFRLSNSGRSHECIFFNAGASGWNSQNLIKGLKYDILFNLNKSENIFDENLLKIQLNIQSIKLLI